MVPTTMVRKVPYVVQRPVVETKTRKVPVTQQRWVTEERVRKVPVRTSKIRYETRKVPQTVQYTEYEEVKRVVRRPVTRQVCEPYSETITVPRQVVTRVPISYYDAFSPAITRGYSTFSDATVSSAMPVVGEVVEESSSTVVEPVDDDEQMSLKPAEGFDGKPQTGLKRVESSLSESSQPSEPQSSSDAGRNNGATENDGVDNQTPQLNQPENNDNGDTDLPAPASVLDAGWKIRWNPKLEHSI
jgi:hypothetical protein